MSDVSGSEHTTFDELFQKRRAALVRFVDSKIHNQAEAEEIVQEVFIKFRAAYDPAQVAAPEALLARIASNLVIDRVRGARARATREENWGKIHIEGADECSAKDASLDPARALAAKQDVQAALQVLEALPSKTRQIFLLHRFEGLSHAEVAARTGIPKSTIEKHMIRAIKALAPLRQRE
ncbi:RNA polymerase sigma factor [Kordiimonas aestuarii]|uniref:RNA polymerase sigma factor n=1 Tax=Kordiimonas aestuarii TaxID=1005925 RepID=UPI0021CFB290|nr:RNA polymerase sigma factor [Kordiimonas aestuarii]